MKKLTTAKLVRIALMAAVLCVLGPLTFPLSFSPVPISLAIFGIFLTLVIIEPSEAFTSIVVYILLGLVGMPVFSNFTGGVGKLFGPTGGYIIGYIPFALISWFFIKKFNRKVPFLVIGMLLGLASCYILGTAWLAISAGMTFKAALVAGVIPFVPFDIIKLVLAILIGLPVRRSIRRFIEE